MDILQLDKQKKYRKITKNKNTIKYEKTPNGFLMRMYRNMQKNEDETDEALIGEAYLH